MKHPEHSENVYAFDIQNLVRHISEVLSGRKGYYCQGCGREMQAKKGEIKFHHFAHDPKEVAVKGKCTYSDETYRHKLAKEILQRIKQIKVPAIRKYPEVGEDGGPYLIEDARVVYASRVEIELPFYESEDGTVLWGKNPELATNPKKFLLIRPDVAFFNDQNQPILLIELVVTNKVTPEKLEKIKCLGIDTIRVSIPKDSPDAIERTFFSTNTTNWIYNHEREHTPYQFVPGANSPDVLGIDAFERRVASIEKSFACRTFEIREAIRRITAFLGSEQFRNAQSSLTGEIQRVSRNTTKQRRQLRELQETIDGEVSAGFESERARLDAIEAELILAEGELRREEKDVEGKYKKETTRIDDDESKYRSDEGPEIRALELRLIELGGTGEPIQDRIRSLRVAEERHEQWVRTEEGNIDGETRDIIDEIATVDAQIEQIEIATANSPDGFVESEKQVRTENATNEEGLRAELEGSEAAVRAEFDRLGKISASAIEDRNPSGTPRLTGAIKKLVDAGGVLGTIPKIAEYEGRLRKARRALDEGSYKTWV